MKLCVIIAAAGSGKRFDDSEEPSIGHRSKVELDLGGRPVFLRSVELFINRPEVTHTLLAVAPDKVEAFRFAHADKLAFHGVKIVPGGECERWQTVLSVLPRVPESCTHVAIHDAARPLTSAALIDRILAAALRFRAVIAAMPVAATLKRVGPDDTDQTTLDPLDDILGAAPAADPIRRVLGTIDRRDLVEAQTPQVFDRELLQRAYAQIDERNFDTSTLTDDASLVEYLGEPVHAVAGESTNMKITTPPDLAMAQAYLAMVEQQKTTGLGPKRLFTHDDDE